MAVIVPMPKLSLTMQNGQIVEWLKKEGEPVSVGEVLANIESDKAIFELEAPQDGIIRKILIETGGEVAIDTPLVIIAGDEEDISSLLPLKEGENQSSPVSTLLKSESYISSPVDEQRCRQPQSPVARRVAKELGVDINKVAGTGVDGLVTEKDVRAFAAISLQTFEHEVEVLPLIGLRRRMAERMTLSRHTAADVTTIVDVDMSEVAEQRKETDLSFTSFVIWAVSRALRDFPILNSSLNDDQILIKKNIHLGVAVTIDDGLVVPVIRDADHKSIKEISKEIDLLAERARSGQLTPDDLKGGTFTITNSGAFGSLMFTPIINQPEVAILGMGKIADTPVIRNGEIVSRKLMYLCLSYDHRVVEGIPAVRFLQSVKLHLETSKDYLEKEPV